MTYLQRKKLAFMTIVNKVKGFIRTISGKFPLTLYDCADAKSVIDYKIYGNTVQGIIPEEYLQVEYIESTGTQYIDTGVIANQNTGFEIEFLSNNTISSASGEYGNIFGARTSSNTDEYQLTTYCAASTPDYLGTFRFGTQSYDGGITIGNKNVISLRNGLYTKNDGSQESLEADFTTPCTVTLFALNNNGSPTQHGSFQLFSFKMYDNDTLIRDFIPCYRKSDSVIGLYDLVDNVFYTNAGTENFVKGLDSVPTTENPIELESTGKLTTKNLLDVKTAYPDYVNDEGGITYDENVLYKIYTTSMLSEYKENTQYTFTADYEITGSEGNSVYPYVEYVDGTTEGFWQKMGGVVTGDKNGKINVTTSNGKTVKKICLAYSYNYKINVKLTNMQIEEGAIATEYEPYQKYKIPIKCSGKNLLDVNKWYPKYSNDEGGITYTNKNFADIFNNIKPLKGEYKENTQYTFSCDYDVVVDTNYVSPAILYTDGTIDGFRYIWTPNSTGTFSGHSAITSQANKTISYIRLGYSSSSKTCKIKLTNMQIEEGVTATEYESFIEPQTTNIYLDEPLRKVEGYADEIDFENGTVTRNVYREYITTVDSNPRTVSPYYTYLTYISKKPKTINREYGCISNKFSNGADYTYSNMKDKANIIQTYITTSGGNTVVYTLDGKYTLTKAQELIGDGFEVCYILATPILESIDLPPLPQFEGTTIYEVDTSVQPSNAEVTYYSTSKE